MARYRGPKSKIARRFKEAIFGPDKALERRTYGPGQHGNARRRKKDSEYSIQLAEKQKAKYTYGILEKQFSNMYKAANAKTGITGEVLLQMCETRLDNIVFRLGLALLVAELVSSYLTATLLLTVRWLTSHLVRFVLEISWVLEKEVSLLK